MLDIPNGPKKKNKKTTNLFIYIYFIIIFFFFLFFPENKNLFFGDGFWEKNINTPLSILLN